MVKMGEGNRDIKASGARATTCTEPSGGLVNEPHAVHLCSVTSGRKGREGVGVITVEGRE